MKIKNLIIFIDIFNNLIKYFSNIFYLTMIIIIIKYFVYKFVF